MEGTRAVGLCFSPRTTLQRRNGNPDRTRPQTVISGTSLTRAGVVPHISCQILGTEFLRPSSLCSVEEKPSVTTQMVLFQLWLCSKKPKPEGELAPPWSQPGTLLWSLLHAQGPGLCGRPAVPSSYTPAHTWCARSAQ